jgi:hypothetical protein
MSRIAVSLLVLTAFTRAAMAGNASEAVGAPIQDPPTLHCLAVYWIIKGDDNKNARVDVQYRKAGAADWRKGPPLFRVEKNAHKDDKGHSKLSVPDDAWLFAGSIFILEPGTEYELKYALVDPDGGNAEHTLMGRTITEPQAPANMTTFHVVPGNGGGTGTDKDPFKGFAAAQEKAAPGTLFLLHAGHYGADVNIDRNGEPGKPIIWRGAGDGEAVFGAAEGKHKDVKAIIVRGCHDVWFEKLTVTHATWGFLAPDSARIVIRRCKITDIHNRAITYCGNESGQTGGWFISDNVVEGSATWPRTKEKGIEDCNAIHGTGYQNIVCYNRVSGFADAIDIFKSDTCVSIDFHNNDVSELTDDGMEMDYSQRNTRCFHNRFTNVYQGISTQPVFGGPVYIFRNALYNVGVEPFKMHNSPSGALMIHNTIVKKGTPLVLQTPEKVRNCVYRNNLFLGSDGRAFHCDPPMIDCDYDFDGFGGYNGDVFMKWNNIRYATIDEVHAKSPIEKHCVAVDPATAFASGVKPPDNADTKFELSVNDLRLKEGSAAIDAGEAMPGFNDDPTGKSPDLGAYEFGKDVPHYGPRPETPAAK